MRFNGNAKERIEALPDPWGEDYAILNDQYPGTAAAPLAGGHCGVCNWEIVPHVRQAVHEGHVVHTLQPLPPRPLPEGRREMSEGAG